MLFEKGRINPNKNKKFEEIYGEERAKELRNQLSNSHKGQKCSENAKIKTSERTKNKTLEEIYGEEKAKEMRYNIKLKNTGKIFSKERRQNISIGHKNQKPTEKCIQGVIKLRKNKSYEEIYGLDKAREIRNKIAKSNTDKHPSEITREKMRWNMLNNVKILKDSKPEKIIQNYLKDLNIEFYTHYYLNIHHYYRCDIFIPSLNIVIECDGDYYHCHPDRFNNSNEIVFRNKKQFTVQEIWDLDKIRTEEILQKGHNILRLWECEIHNLTLENFENLLYIKNLSQGDDKL